MTPSKKLITYYEASYNVHDWTSISQRMRRRVTMQRVA